MLQDRQVERMVNKVSRLGEGYQPYLIEETINPCVTVVKDGKSVEVHKGFKWGKDFSCEQFSFVAEGLTEGRKYYLFADTGAVEHLVSVNGNKVGLLDYIDNAMDPTSRVHKYLLLEGLLEGDSVALQAYYSHPMPGTMPYETKSTFSFNGYYPDRRYNSIGLVSFYQPLKQFGERLTLLNKLYNSESDQFQRAEIEKVYQQLFVLLPLRQVRPEESLLNRAIEIIDTFFAGEKKLPYVGIIGHSHLDTAWLWTVEETRRKLMRTASNAVTLLNRHPEYKFFMSTVLYLQWIEKDDPKLFRQISQLISEGRFEPNGSTWVECDGNLTGSEAFCRQFVRGKRYLRKKFNYESDTFWLPDTFGYSAALPQIMKKCNVEYFLTTKLSWNDTNKFPYETFIWKGIDGSEVPVHFNTIHTWVDEEAVHKRLSDIADKRESNCALMAYGFGDGGGGPSEEMVSRAIYTQQFSKNAQVRHTTVSEFMEKVTAQELPTYFGELYLELHRGTYTTNHNLKWFNRRLEEALHDAELVSVLDGDKDAKQLTDSLYDTLLLNQFHDILPGTSIAEATDIALAEQSDALKKAHGYVKGKGAGSYFNTLPFERKEVLPSSKGQTYNAVDGTRTVATYKFDAFGYAKREVPKGEFVVDGDDIITPHLKVTIKEGVLTSLIYKGKQYVKEGFNILATAEDVPYIYDNWDVDADYVYKQQPVKFVGQHVESVGEILVVKSMFSMGNSTLETDIKLRLDSPLVEFENKLTWNDTHTLLRTYFDTTIFSQHYKCETQFGNVERNCFPRDKSDIAKFEVCSHKWTDISQNNCGLSLISDCKYGVSCQGGKLGLTLHKSGTHPDARGDVGVSYFRYAVLPHEGELGMETIRQAYCFNMLPVKTARKNLKSPFTLTGDNSVIVETVKHGEDDGIVLRMYECLGGGASVTLSAEDKQFVECNILEDEQQSVGNNSVQLTFAPFEIKTVKIK